MTTCSCQVSPSGGAVALGFTFLLGLAWNSDPSVFLSFNITYVAMVCNTNERMDPRLDILEGTDLKIQSIV